ncbi:MAG: hydroxymethylbilane synthase [Gemmatimonadaceae bacterium]
MLRVGTRGSPLALAQTGLVCDALRQRWPEVEVRIERITTTGDVRRDVPLATLGRGAFVSEIEAALRERRVDVAVHSAKDLPSRLAPEMRIAAVLERADPRDVLVSRGGATLRDLPPGARVGTGSPRRACQLRASRPDLEVLEVRGNVDTRLRKLAAGDFDALVLAAAGLIRLGRADEATEWLDPGVMVPAVAQGAIAVEVRADDAEVAGLVTALDHAATAAAVSAERAFLARLGAGCTAAVAALATVSSDALSLAGLVGAPDGRNVRGTRVGTVGEAEAVGDALADELLEFGGAAFLELADR